MNKFQIGENAGKVWRLLANDNKRWNYYDLKETSGLSDRDLNAAIGWLAHDGSICFGHSRGENNVSLGINVYIG